MKKEYDGSKVYLSLAGSGDPWSSLTQLRKRILRELHDTPDIIELASLMQMEIDDLKAEIQPLIDSSLVFESDEGFRPSFLVADDMESKLVYDQACEFGKRLADTISENYEGIKSAYHTLKSGRYAPHSLGEFICWYAHVAYASAIQILEERGVISTPS